MNFTPEQRKKIREMDIKELRFRLRAITKLKTLRKILSEMKAEEEAKNKEKKK